MKKLVLTSMAMVMGAVLAHAQGTISMNTIAAQVDTNGVAQAAAGGPAGTYLEEVLDLTQAQYAGLSGAQQTAAYNLFANPTDLSLWTDAGVSGESSAHVGGIQSLATATANNWVAPSSNAGYNTASGYDYYTIVGWNSASYANYAALAAALNSGTLAPGTWFGQTAVAFNYAGGGASGLGAVGLFSTSAQTQLAGSGGLPTTGSLVLNQVTIVPEPATLALAGLGGLSMLFLRRRKA